VKDWQLAKEMRLDKRLTVDEVATAMGIGYGDYLAIERGENSRGARTAQDAILKMPPRWDRPEEHRGGTGC
jgi:transcriptional regulator with XRE-family HTH domain